MYDCVSLDVPWSAFEARKCMLCCLFNMCCQVYVHMHQVHEVRSADRSGISVWQSDAADVGCVHSRGESLQASDAMHTSRGGQSFN